MLKSFVRSAMVVLTAGLTACIFSGSSAVAQGANTVTIQISAKDAVPISPLLYGINYDFNIVTAEDFPKFADQMKQVSHVPMARFPGGWNAEWYDWEKNIEYGKRAPASPGAPPASVMAAFPTVTFITPSQGAISDPTQIGTYTTATASLVKQYGTKIRYWEIGNEWWLQSGAKNHDQTRERNLKAYAKLLDSVVPVMKRANPSIQIFATGDWTKPDDIATLRELTGKTVWAQIDGISLHSYCGTQDSGPLCSTIPKQFADIRRITGKDQLYASEWAAVRADNVNDFGIRAANYNVNALQYLAFAGVQLGAYWPPVREVPALSFVSGDLKRSTPLGTVFGWMSTYYQGAALHVSGDPLTIAARNKDQINIIIATLDTPQQQIKIDLAGTGVNKVVSAEVLFSASPDDPQASQQFNIVNLPTTIITDPDGHRYVQLVLNPGTSDRGKACEIARLTLQE